ncbi:MAG: hypothetical protein H6851_14995 [Geminicoccaceae bacterium]|nr:hypothetical protein [Geminicoccaceae bacterium]MCB9944913.1 hypothetical protein [Geminicoccaceae bacterium]
MTPLSRRKTASPISFALVALTVLAAGQAAAQTGNQEKQVWERTLATGQAPAFSQFLARYPAGPYSSDAFRCLVEFRIDSTAEACSLRNGNGPPRPKHTETGHFVANLK